MDNKQSGDGGIRVVGWRRQLIEAIESRRTRNHGDLRRCMFIVEFTDNGMCRIFETTQGRRIDLDPAVLDDGPKETH